jgi:hypothetical protein
VPVAVERCGDQEHGDLVGPAVPVAQRGHRPDGVRGQQAHHGVDVAAPHGVHVALDHLAQALVAQRAQGRLLRALGQALVDRPAGALQGAVDRRDRRLERLGDLLPREAQHLAQDERGALVGRQVLQRCHEGELDALASLVARLGSRAPVDEPELLVGIRLDPGRLDQRRPRRVVGVGGRAVVDRQHPPGPALDGGQRRVGRYPVQPGAQRASPLEARQPAPGAQQGVLEGVLGVVDRAEHPVAVGVQRPAVGLDEAPVGILVAAAGGIEEVALQRADGCGGGGHRYS